MWLARFRQERLGSSEGRLKSALCPAVTVRSPPSTFHSLGYHLADWGAKRIRGTSVSHRRGTDPDDHV
jgi:hypothetical protein